MSEIGRDLAKLFSDEIPYGEKGELPSWVHTGAYSRAAKLSQ